MGGREKGAVFMGSLESQKGDAHTDHREFKRFIYDVLL